jgi:hypothetical protein
MAGAVAASAGAAEPSAHAVLASIDLTHTFGTRSAWFFTASQAAPGQDPLGMSDEVAGVVTICLRNGASGACDPQLRGALHAPSDDPFNLPHYLIQARIVYPDRNSRRPLLLVKTASLHSGDGDQLELTQVLAYESGADQFVRIFELSTGHNNNQEVRYMDAGPLQGDIISVEPTENAPFGFWVSVNALTPSYTYQQSVRYRSATRYGDGNPLSVIDSEMPNIQQNLGLWRPGSPLPLTASPCPRPHLVRAELWCK